MRFYDEDSNFVFLYDRTELCAFSEYRIYPGHGMRFIRRDGQPITISSSKCASMVHQKKKPAKLMWTQAWRRLNKKGKDENAARKRLLHKQNISVVL